MSTQKQSKDKQNKTKVPNAYEINPGLMQGLAQITPQNMLGFLFSNPQLAPQKFKKTLWKKFKSFGGLITSNFIGGVAINMIITRNLPHILILPNITRLPLRLSLFALPFAVCYPKIKSFLDEYDNMMEEQYLKIQKFRKTGNIEQYMAS